MVVVIPRCDECVHWMRSNQTQPFHLGPQPQGSVNMTIHIIKELNLITSMWTRRSTAELYNTNLLRNELIWSLPGFHLQWGRKLNLSLGVIKVMLLGLEWSSRHVVCTLHLSVHTSYTYLLSILITTVWKKTYHWGFSFIFFFCFLYNILLKIYKKKCSGHKWKQLTVAV